MRNALLSLSALAAVTLIVSGVATGDLKSGPQVGNHGIRSRAAVPPDPSDPLPNRLFTPYQYALRR